MTDQEIDELNRLAYDPWLDENHVHTDEDVYGKDA